MPTVNTITTSSLLSENLEVEETLDGMNQPYYYFTERKIRPNKNKILAQDQKEPGLQTR